MTTAKRDGYHSKSLFLVKIKDNGTQKAVQRQRMRILLCEQFFFGTFGFEMRACGQKLVKFCAHTHTHAAKLVARIYTYARTHTHVLPKYRLIGYKIMLKLVKQLVKAINA